ncbi:hypothetical protein [Halorubrum saccharovorum]|uniref:hypothetical protein n=1 Tax=Halorubrum saccharovorum TaxID=2248 RepID=UPI00135F17AB|nr:hypothetical protein [Halorubrum saccharovorum]
MKWKHVGYMYAAMWVIAIVLAAEMAVRNLISTDDGAIEENRSMNDRNAEHDDTEPAE